MTKLSEILRKRSNGELKTIMETAKLLLEAKFTSDEKYLINMAQNFSPHIEKNEHMPHFVKIAIKNHRDLMISVHEEYLRYKARRNDSGSRQSVAGDTGEEAEQQLERRYNCAVLDLLIAVFPQNGRTPCGAEPPPDLLAQQAGLGVQGTGAHDPINAAMWRVGKADIAGANLNTSKPETKTAKKWQDGSGLTDELRAKIKAAQELANQKRKPNIRSLGKPKK